MKKERVKIIFYKHPFSQEPGEFHYWVINEDDKWITLENNTGERIELSISELFRRTFRKIKLPMEFVNAQEMRIKNPDTIYAPSKEDLDELKTGLYVKVCDGKERFWVKISEISGESVKGTVENDLLSGTLKVGDELEFEKKHIYDIQEW